MSTIRRVQRSLKFFNTSNLTCVCMYTHTHTIYFFSFFTWDNCFTDGRYSSRVRMRMRGVRIESVLTPGALKVLVFVSVLNDVLLFSFCYYSNQQFGWLIASRNRKTSMQLFTQHKVILCHVVDQQYRNAWV